MRRAWILVPVAACYSAEPNAGAPCSAHGQCPRDQTCVLGVCEASGSDGRDGPLSPGDAPLDGPDSLEGWGPATPVLASGMLEAEPAFTDNGNTVYFRSRASATSNDDVYKATRNGTGYTIAALGNPIDTGKNEGSPEPVTASLSALYYVTDHNGAYDVWFSYEFVGSFGTPQKDANLSSSLADLAVAISPDATAAVVARADGLCYHFTRNALGGAWIDETPLADLPGPCGGPTLAADGTLYYHRDAGGTRGIWVAHPDATGAYPIAAPVVELNTTARSSDPYVSADAHTIMFERDGVIVGAQR